MSRAIAIVLATTIGLGLGQARAQNPPSPTSTTAAASFAPNQQKLLTELASFFGRVGQAAPGDPQGRPLSVVIPEWSNETRTIRVKTGERIETLTYPAGAVRKVDILEDRTVTRIYFGPFTGKDEGGTSAEYDPQFGVVKLSEAMALWAEPPKVARPKYGEMNVSHTRDLIQRAQTIWHEFFHSTQGEEPDTIANETAAWHATLGVTGEWFQRLQENYNNARTLENARYLLAVSDAWKDYYGAIENKTTLGEIEKRPMPSAELATLAGVREQVSKELQAIEILEDQLGPSLIPGVARTLDEMLGEIEATSAADLEGELLRIARQHVDQDKFRNYDAARKDQEARRQAQAALAIVRPAWERKYSAAVAAAKKMSSCRLTISTPEPAVEIDAKTGQAALTVSIENETDYRQLAGDFARLLYNACGPKGTVTVAEHWMISGQPSAATPWTAGDTKSIQLDTPKQYKIALVRTLTMGVDLAAHGVPKSISAGSNEISVKVNSPSPADISGQWTGKFTITAIPLVDKLKAIPQPQSSPAPDPAEAFAEGCSIPPEMFTEMVAKLERLKGQGMELTFTIQPDSIEAGKITLRITPPEGSGITPGDPKTLAYRYVPGLFTAQSVEDKVKLSMGGTFQPAAPGWELRGNWQVHVEHEGKPFLAIHGTWSGTNHNAK